MESEGDSVYPPLFRRHARRPRLTRLLNESSAQAIVVTAPAGYGKTTLAAEWLQGRSNVIWYHATSASADVAAFSAGLADVISALMPGVGDRIKQRLRVADTPERAARPLAELLAEDIAGWPEGALLVIDDYHLVADSEPVEDFFDWLLTLSPQLRVLVTSRRRPRWASARRILYGEITEIDRDQLAMNAEEAGRVLDDRSDEVVRALVAQAEGWPALIGLAALTEREIPEERVSEALYRYFAEEVVRGEAPEVERFMLLASVPSTIDARTARDVLRFEEPDETLDWLVSQGLLHAAAGEFRFHPLLRTFLRRKLETEEPVLYRELVDRAIDSARSAERWEDAFDLAAEMGQLKVALDVLEAATPDFLASGRIETLKRWFEDCGPQAGDHPGALLTRAEVLLREGRFGEASAVAETVIKQLTPNDRLASRAFLAAGQARYLRSQNPAAADFYAIAVERANTHAERENALWGAFLAELDLDVDQAEHFLDELDNLSEGDLNTRLRALTGRQTLASHRGTFKGIWELVEPAIALVEYATDPLVKSNVLAQVAYLAIARGEFARALELVNLALRYSVSLRHDFATGSCLAYRAAASIGLRHLRAARRDLRELSRIHSWREDPYLQTEHLLMRVRLALAQGDLGVARTIATDFPRTLPDGATLGEHLGLASIICAALGERANASDLADSAARATCGVEARIYASFGMAISEFQRSDRNVEALADAVQSAADVEFLEAIVTAYRAFPALLAAVAADGRLVRVVVPVVLRAHDAPLARRAGMSVPEDAGPAATAGLTRREAEVLDLLGEGLSNAEIAQRLFITRSTAKVHVHHILEKLGVKTRLQAALIARREDD
jgi:LuxR family transcriptional regulator, maltose regulon positive regulatory protein